MDTQPSFGPHDVFNHVISDMAHAVSQRRDEPQPRRLARAQEAAGMIAAFQPGDAVEALLAGHCVMFHELIVDSVQITLRGELDATRRATRSGIVAMDKAFGANLLRLERYRTQKADSAADEAQPTVPRAEIEIADRVYRHQSSSASAKAQPDPVASSPSVNAGAAEPISPSDTAHSAPFLPAILGDDRPHDANPATVAQMPGLNRQARRAIVRQARKRLAPAASTTATTNRHVHT